jgi:hypothetical protein
MAWIHIVGETKAAVGRPHQYLAPLLQSLSAAWSTSAYCINRLGGFRVTPHLPHQPLRLYKNDVASGKKPF